MLKKEAKVRMGEIDLRKRKEEGPTDDATRSAETKPQNEIRRNGEGFSNDLLGNN